MFKHFKKNIMRHQTRFMVFMLVSMLIARFAAHYFQWGWHFAAALAFGLTAIYFAYAQIMHDDFLKKIIWFALIAGFTELAADWWLVDITQTLVYPSGEPIIVRSPIYMPFAWCMVLTNIGYVAYALTFKETRLHAILTAFFIGITVIPLFEHFARGAGWWYYQDCKMIWDVPYYIILGEGLICCMLGFLLRYLNTHKYQSVIILGILQGLWIWVSYYIAFSIFE